MKELLDRHGIAGQALLAGLAAGLLCGPAAGQTIVTPGQTGVSIVVEIENAADSGADIGSAQATATSQDPAVLNIQYSPASSVAPGQVKTFTITFDVAGTANDGPISLLVKDIIEDPVDPDPSANDTLVNFIRKRPPILDERA